MTAPSLFIPDPASAAYVQGEIGKGGIVVRSVAEAVTLAEALLDWAYKDEPPCISWPYLGRRLAHKASKRRGQRKIRTATKGKEPGKYTLVPAPDSEDYEAYMAGKIKPVEDRGWEDGVLPFYEVQP